MSTVIEQFVAELGWDIDNKEFNKFRNQIKDAGRDLLNLTKWIVGGAAAITGMATAANKATAEQYRLAQSVGASAESMEALAGVAGGIGLNYENVIDLVEEMNNKLGEMKGLGEMTAVKESMKILKMDFRAIKDLKPEEQFEQIIDAAVKLEDQSKAVSAVDMLMGGEANKIIGFLRTQGTTLEELVTKYRRLNMQTEEGRRGALKYSDSFRTSLLVVGSSIKEFSGIFGQYLAPYIDIFNKWAADNKELIQLRLHDWAKKSADFVADLGIALLKVAVWIKRISDYLPSIEAMAIAFAGWKIGQLVGGVLGLAGAFGRLDTASGGAAKGLAGIGQKLPMIGGLAGIIAISIDSIQKELAGEEGAFHSIGVQVGEAMSKLDEFAAQLMGIDVHTFRDRMLDAINAIKQGYLGLTKIMDDLHKNTVRTARSLIKTGFAFNPMTGGGGVFGTEKVAPAPAPAPAAPVVIDNRRYSWQAPMSIQNNGSQPITKRDIQAGVEKQLTDAVRAASSGKR